jgi:hypothetical protein
VHAASIVARMTGSLTPAEQTELARLCTKLREGAPSRRPVDGTVGSATS